MPRKPSSKQLDLLLTPTALELDAFRTADESLPRPQLCGFGVVAAAARAASLIERLQPRRVMLIGIAGTYDPDRMRVGEASSFGVVTIDGIGVVAGGSCTSAIDLGFAHWPGDERSPPVGDELPLQWCRDGDVGCRLLTTCAASGSEAEHAMRREREPRVLAEDMEGFGVALACAMLGTPLAIVRGISNIVGDRETSSWPIAAAMAAAAACARGLLTRDGGMT